MVQQNSMRIKNVESLRKKALKKNGGYYLILMTGKKSRHVCLQKTVIFYFGCYLRRDGTVLLSYWKKTAFDGEVTVLEL